MPDRQDISFADAYLEAAEYELGTASLLSESNRLAPGVAHAQIAAELALKSVLYRSVGRASFPASHYVARIVQHQVKRAWSDIGPQLQPEVCWLEDTYPQRSGGRNTRYPFGVRDQHGTLSRVDQPSAVYTEDEAKLALRVARKTLKVAAQTGARARRRRARRESRPK